MVQRLSFGLSFLQRMDMKPIVIMGWSEGQDVSGPLAGSQRTQGLVERSKQLTEALQSYSAAVLPLFSAESFLLLEQTQPGSRWVLRIKPSTSVDVHSSCLGGVIGGENKQDSCAWENFATFRLGERKWRYAPYRFKNSRPKTWVGSTCFFCRSTHIWTEPQVLPTAFFF